MVILRKKYDKKTIVTNAIDFLGSKNRDIAKLKDLRGNHSNGGFCNGFTFLWGFTTIQTLFVNPKNKKPRDDRDWFFKISYQLQEKKLDEISEPELDNFFGKIVFLQSSDNYIYQSNQNNLEAYLEYSSTDSDRMTPSLEYSLGGEFTQDELSTILSQIVHDGRFVVIHILHPQYGGHALGLVKKDNQYFLYSGTEELIFQDPEDFKLLAGEIFKAGHCNDLKMGMGFQSFYFDSENFEKEYKSKPQYPAQADILKSAASTISGLCMAAKVGCVESVKHLLKTQQDVNQLSASKNSPLYLACERGHLAVVDVLLAHQDIDVNQLIDDVSPLYKACQDGHLAVVKALLAHKDIKVNHSASEGPTPLHIACQKGHLAVVKVLLAHKDIKVNQSMKAGISPLHMACHKNEIAIAKALLAHKDIDVNQLMAQDMSALRIACQKGHLEIVNLLKNHKKIAADQLEISLSTAYANGHYDCVEALLENPNTKIDKVVLLLIKEDIKDFINIYYDPSVKNSALAKIEALHDNKALIEIFLEAKSIEAVIHKHPADKHLPISQMSPECKRSIAYASEKCAENLERKHLGLDAGSTITASASMDVSFSGPWNSLCLYFEYRKIQNTPANQIILNPVKEACITPANRLVLASA